MLKKDPIFVIFPAGLALAALCFFSDSLRASERVEVRQEKECGYVLDEKNVRLGKTTAYVTLELDGRTEDNFATIDGAVCAFKLAYPSLGVRSVFVDQVNARQEAPVIVRDRVKGLLLLFNRN